jgi:TolB-like protein
MRFRRCIILLAVCLAPVVARAEVKKVRVAVLDFRPLGTEQAKADLLSEVALTQASRMAGFEVIGRSDIAAMIGFEKQKQVLGCSEDSSCLAEVGGALGVDLIMVGSLGRLGTLYRIDLKVVDTKKAKVRGRIGVSVEGQEEKLVAAIEKTVRELLEPFRPTEQPAVAAAPAGEPVKPARAAPALTPRPPETGSTAPLGSPPREAEAGAGRSSRRTWAWVAGGAGLAVFAGGVVAGLQARAAFDDQKAASAAGDLAAFEDNKSKARSMSIVADSLFVAGAAGMGVGTWLWFTSRPAPVALHLAPVAGGAMASMSGEF